MRDVKMEYLDIYDDEGNFLGKEERGIVHEKGLWHKTVHCWLYTKDGYVFFQRRADSHTLYTTASGHLRAGETINEGFHREIKEEIGCSIDTSDDKFIKMEPYKMDKIKNGKPFKDRVFANVYMDLYEGNFKDFNFDQEEVLELALVPLKETLAMFKKNEGFVLGKIVTPDHQIIDKEISLDEFLVNAGETYYGKYGYVLEAILKELNL